MSPVPWRVFISLGDPHLLTRAVFIPMVFSHDGCFTSSGLGPLSQLTSHTQVSGRVRAPWWWLR